VNNVSKWHLFSTILHELAKLVILQSPSGIKSQNYVSNVSKWHLFSTLLQELVKHVILQSLSGIRRRRVVKSVLLISLCIVL
jgi:hypothetical protein